MGAVRRRPAAPRCGCGRRRHARRRVETVFFGGGTPSLLPLDDLSGSSRRCASAFDIAPEAEVSFEANPGTVDARLPRAACAALASTASASACSRSTTTSCGARPHPLRGGGEGGVPLGARGRLRAHQPRPDLRPAGADDGSLAGDARAGDRARPGAPLALRADGRGRHAAGARHRARASAGAGRRHAGRRCTSGRASGMAAAGYQQYEISNWCRPGEECRHNLVYWRNGDWLGLGPGAHSHLRSQV